MKKTLLIIGIALALLFFGVVICFAQNKPISALPVATTPLAGTELIPIVQNGVTKQTTIGAISGLAPCCSIITGNPIGTANLYLGNPMPISGFTGSNNLVTGFASGGSLTTASFNAVYGTAAFNANNIGSSNTILGAGSAALNTSGSFNLAAGAASLVTNMTGSNLTALGAQTDVATDGLTNSIALGYGAVVTQSDQLVVGSTATPVSNWVINNVPYVMPAVQGTAGSVLTNNGSGTLAWTPSGGTGTVTSITAGTGLTGGTITGSGTIALSSPVAIANGGTGQTTANAALNALLPSQSGVTSGYALTTNGTNTAWTSVGAPVYTQSEIPFGDGSTAGGITSADLKYSPNGSTPFFDMSFETTSYGWVGTRSLFNIFNPSSYSVSLGDWTNSLGNNAYLQINLSTGVTNFGNGNITINTVPYHWPNVQGTANTYLKNDGSGNLTWSTPSGSGTVTSITAGTGLTGGTITGSGTIALSSPVAIANGGTGQTTANAALNALLPSQSGVTSGYALTTNGTNTAWTSVSAPVYAQGEIPYGNASTPGGTTGDLILGVGDGFIYPTNFALIDPWNSNATIFSVSGKNGGAGEQTIFEYPAISIDAVPYVFPSAQGAAGTVLTNDGTGGLSWQTSSGTVPTYSSSEIPYGDGSTAGGATNQYFTFDGNGWFRIACNFGYYSFATGGCSAPYDSLGDLNNINGEGILAVGTGGRCSWSNQGFDIGGVTYNWTNVQGYSNSVLTNDGSGNLSWQTPSSVVASADLTGQNSTTTVLTYTNSDGVPHNYEVGAYVSVTTGPSSNYFISVSWTDENGETPNGGYIFLNGGYGGGDYGDSFESFMASMAFTPVMIRLGAGQTVTVSTVNGSGGTYDISSTITFLN